MQKSITIILSVLFLTSCLFSPIYSQTTESKPMLKDTLDGQLDLSRFVLQAKGFIPVAFIITEPALGGIGLGVAPLFISPKTKTDSSTYTPPDITTIFGMYTANETWAVGAGRSGSFPKQKLKYRIAGGYSSINLSLYRDLPQIGETEFEFNFKSTFVHLALSKEISHTGLYGGLNYLYLHTKVSPNFDDAVPEFVSSKELDSQTSSIGLFLEIDKRNSIFTPDKGFYSKLTYSINDDWTGSDYHFQRLNFRSTWFQPLSPNWISGLRMEYQQVFDDPPFYLLPSIDMRGVPASRYQGTSTLLLETEQRYDFNLRWSGLAFGGVGKALGRNQSFSNADLVYGVGGGFRYLLARVLNFRTGLDVAYGPEGWSYYFVFGHAWNR